MKSICKSLILFSFIIVIMPFGATASSSNNIISKKDIFRHVNLNQGNKIVLGDTFESIKSLTKTLGDRIYLNENLFGFVESIELVFNSKNRLSEIIFEYHDSKSLNELVNSYIELFGAPIHDSETIYWEDENTRFEILYFSEGIKVFSKMIDLQ